MTKWETPLKNELPPLKMEKMAKTEGMGAMAKTDVTESKAFRELKAKMVEMGAMEWMVLMVCLSPLLVLISMVALLLAFLVVLNSMLVKLLLLTLRNPSKLLLMVAALLSLSLIP